MGKKLILEYKLIRGLPHVVDEEVQTHIGFGTGWQPKGKLIKLKLSTCEILIQCMVRYES